MKMIISNKNNINLFITLIFLLLTQTYLLKASTVDDITNFPNHAKQSDEVESKLSRYGNFIRSSGTFLDDQNLFETLFGGKQVAPVPMQRLNAVSGKAKKLISWIRRQSLQDTSQEDENKTLDSKVMEKVAEQSQMAKRMMNCKPLKEQFKEFRGK